MKALIAVALLLLVGCVSDPAPLTNEDVVRLYENNFDEITAVWVELGDAGEDATLRDAVEEWQKRKAKPCGES